MAINFPSSPATGDAYTYLNSIYQYDGTHWSKIGGVTGQVLATQVFTASGTYTPTTGMEYCIIECVGSGAGGGGCASATNQAIGGGGGGGSYARKLASATTIGASQTVTIGNAGTGGTAGPNNGTNGSDVSVGTICIGKGGSGGQGVTSDNAGTGGAGGVAGTGDFTMVGGNGWNGQLATVTTVNLQGGSGGASGLGYGVATGTVGFTNAGPAGKLYGGGGGGASSRAAGGAVAGGDGAKGIVIITEFSRSSPVPGVASSTDEAIVRFDGTAGRAQNSGLFVGDSNNLYWGSGAANSVSFNYQDGASGAFQGVMDKDTGYAQWYFTNSGDSTHGSFLYTFHNSASPAVGDDVGGVEFVGKDSAATNIFYGGIECWTTGVTAGAVGSEFRINLQNAGSQVQMKLVPGGIQFPATQVDSAGANVLDDYEEGTWTPSMTFITPGDLSITWSAQLGLYTKIGRNVYINMRNISSAFTWTTSSSNVRITGIPFVVGASMTSGTGVGTVSLRGYTKTNYTQIILAASSGSASLQMQASGSGQTSIELTPADMPSGGSLVILASGHYIV